MTAQRFNPLTNANKLKAAGLASAIAEEIAQQQADLINDELFTKQDGLLVKQELTNELKNMELRIYKAIFAMFIAFGIIQHFFK